MSDDHVHHTIDYVEIGAHRPAEPAKAFYAAAFGWPSTTTARPTPASSGPTATARSAGSTPWAPSAAAGRWCCCGPPTSTPPVAAVTQAGGEVVQGPYDVPRRTPVPLHRPRGNELGVWGA